jgi:hypothetical protein
MHYTILFLFLFALFVYLVLWNKCQIYEPEKWGKWIFIPLWLSSDALKIIQDEKYGSLQEYYHAWGPSTNADDHDFGIGGRFLR